MDIPFFFPNTVSTWYSSYPSSCSFYSLRSIEPPVFGYFTYFLKNIYFYVFIWLHRVLIVACRLFSCGMWNLVSWPGIETAPPALGAQSLIHWTTREVPGHPFSFLQRIYMGVELLDHVITLFNYLRTWQTVSQSSRTILCSDDQ